MLQTLQEAAAAAGRLFPLSLGAEASCTIGGNLATDAGGTGVLRYGTMRDLTLGLEVVLPDGRVWNGLRGLRKDNTGCDLKQLFIGAEGTLGVITAAVLELFPAVRSRATAWVALPGVRAVTYGHVGDGNLHYNLSKPMGADDEGFRARAAVLSRIVHDSTAAFDGSTSAEHGLGQFKRDVIADYKSPLELELMHGVKRLLDPAGLMNPGKVLPG